MLCIKPLLLNVVNADPLPQSTWKTSLFFFKWLCEVNRDLVVFQMVFDYQYIDPGPDDPSGKQNRYLALNVSHTVT